MELLPTNSTSEMQVSLAELLIEVDVLERMAEFTRSRFEGSISDVEQAERKVLQPHTTHGTPSKQQDSVNKLDRVIEQVDFGFKRRQTEFLEMIFEQHSVKLNDVRYIPAENMPHALFALKIPTIDPKALYLELDENNDGMLEFCEFEKILNKSDLERWAKSVPLHRVLADAIPYDDDDLQKETDWLRKVSELDDAAIDTVCTGLLHGLKRVVAESVQSLRSAYASMDAAKQSNDQSTKFVVNKMSCGTTDDFHRGLEGRVGAPHLKFMDAMRAEHCSKYGSDVVFETSNYRIRTTPAAEWKLVAEREGLGDAEFAAVLEQRFPGVGLGDGHHGRRIPDISELMREESAQVARLQKVEVTSIVLYTGPMVYNTILRRWPSKEFEAFLAGNNLYSTTIHVLVSAVQKLSRSVRIPDGTLLYRGLGGTLDLPDAFFKPDGLGCKGYAEWAFMSTTANKEVALQYSGVRQGRPKAMVLVIRAGAVDRGACLQPFSQYVQEKEYLWLPLSFLQPHGDRCVEVTARGVVEMVPVRVIPNLKTSTVEEALAKKKTMHVTAFKYLIDEIQREVEELLSSREALEKFERDILLSIQINGGGAFQTEKQNYLAEGNSLGDFQHWILEKCKQSFDRHDHCNEVEYSDDNKYRALVVEMSRLKTVAISPVRLWLDNPVSRIKDVLHWGDTLQALFRQYISYLKEQLKKKASGGEPISSEALRLCQLLGLVNQDPNEVNDNGETKLEALIYDGSDLESLKLLIEAGADINALNVLVASCQRYTPDALHFLIECGADFKRHSYELLTRSRNDEHATALLEARADVNDRHAEFKYTALYWACESGNVDRVKLLLSYKADVHLCDVWGWSPYLTVTRRNQGKSAERDQQNKEIVDLLRAAEHSQDI